MASSRAGAVGPQFFITLRDVAFLETSGVYDQLGKISSGRRSSTRSRSATR